jgi:hypothetical protein
MDLGKRIKGTAAALCAASALLTAGCGGGEVADAEASTTTTTSTTTTSPTTISTTTSTTTTTEPAPAAKDLAPSSPGVYEFDWTSSQDSWPYRMRLEFTGTDPSPTIDCLSTANPDSTYIRFSLSITNLLKDRPAVAHRAGTWLTANVAYGGSVEPTDEPVIDTVGVNPHSPLIGQGFECDGMGTPGGDIGPGATATYTGWIGPVLTGVAADPSGLFLNIGQSPSGELVRASVPSQT